MRSFLRQIFRFAYRSAPARNPKQTVQSSARMSSSSTAAALYAATISTSSITGAVPEEAKEKRHHLKAGKGFINPWESWKTLSAPNILRAMAGLGHLLTIEAIH